MAHCIATPRTGSSPRSGFSLIEVVVAIVILTIGVLGLGGTTAYIVRQVTLADVMTERATALQSVIERVNAMPFANIGSGSDSVGVFAVSWTSTADGGNSRVVRVITRGPGMATSATNPFPALSPSVPDTFEFRVNR